MRTAILLPGVIVLIGPESGSVVFLIAAVAVQYRGRVVERWYFLARANPPRNNDHQCAS